MKAIILAAGKGSRIKEITDGKPKSFLRIGDKTIIQHQINVLKNSGIEKIIIITGYKKDYFEDFKKDGIIILYNPFYEITNVLGSFWFAKDHLTEPFIFLHADTYFHPKILQLLKKYPGNNLAIELKKCGEEEMKVKIKEGLVIEISKEMTESDGEFIGIAKIENFKEIKNIVEELIETNTTSFFEVTFTALIKKGITFNVTDIGNLIWEEIDFKEDYNNLLTRLKLVKD